MTTEQLQALAWKVKEAYDKDNAQKGYNPWGIKEYCEGLTGDLGDLTKLIMAKEGYRNGEEVDTKIAHELSDILWSVLVIAILARIDLEIAFEGTMHEILAKLGAEGHIPESILGVTPTRIPQEVIDRIWQDAHPVGGPCRSPMHGIQPHWCSEHGGIIGGLKPSRDRGKPRKR